jgi:lipopolysaccharide transport system ATP-binding protein
MPAIKVENLSKSYLVGHNVAKTERYTALRDVIARNARDLARKTRDMIHGRPIIQGDEVEEFWALKDVSFEVQHGETLGIIGRNGAGKSTLLKILSRITEPTTGRITLNGRVASLLEVGTGFHPELSGRENIFLNGAILGMSRGEIQRKFDEIVDFAEVENFLDTPVKRYSSGMYVRLAFAVAAHLEPEILIVDEVLAVGDIQFQKKCLGKMGDVAKKGRTVLFVSHNMEAVRSLCEKAILLQEGSTACQGYADDIIKNYLGFDRTPDGILKWDWPENVYRPFAEYVKVLHFSVCSERDRTEGMLFKSRQYQVLIDADINREDRNIIFFLAYYSQDMKLLLVSECYDAPTNFSVIPRGRIQIEAPVPIEFLNTGTYFVELSCVVHRVGWVLQTGNAPLLEFEIGDDLNSASPDIKANHPFTGRGRPGYMTVSVPWTVYMANQITSNCDGSE